MHVPVQDYLSRSLVVLLGEVPNNRFIKQIKILEVLWTTACLKILVGAKWSISGNRGLELPIEVHCLILG